MLLKARRSLIRLMVVGGVMFQSVTITVDGCDEFYEDLHRTADQLKNDIEDAWEDCAPCDRWGYDCRPYCRDNDWTSPWWDDWGPCGEDDD